MTPAEVREAAAEEQTQTEIAPTTEEVREMVDAAHRRVVVNDYATDRAEAQGERMVLRCVALPLAEDRDRHAAETARLTKLLDGLAEHAARGSRAALEAAMVAIYDDWRARMAAMARAKGVARG